MEVRGLAPEITASQAGVIIADRAGQIRSGATPPGKQIRRQGAQS
jgi:hypothetical protein